jgi:hypothetical protein
VTTKAPQPRRGATAVDVVRQIGGVCRLAGLLAVRAFRPSFSWASEFTTHGSCTGAKRFEWRLGQSRSESSERLVNQRADSSVTLQINDLAIPVIATVTGPGAGGGMAWTKIHRSPRDLDGEPWPPSSDGPFGHERVLLAPANNQARQQRPTLAFDSPFLRSRLAESVPPSSARTPHMLPLLL